MEDLLVSISGVRGRFPHPLSSEVAARYSLAFARSTEAKQIVIGRDTRPSGERLLEGVISGLYSAGCNIELVGIVTTPTLGFVTHTWGVDGGVMVTASHNPIEYNGLKFFGPDGLFLNSSQIAQLKRMEGSIEPPPTRPSLDRLRLKENLSASSTHLKAILGLVDSQLIRSKGFIVVVDPVNGAGSVIAPQLLGELGCKVVGINCRTDAPFPRGPEPVPENVGELCLRVKDEGADVGFALDPDGDRLSLISEEGVALGEEYTLALAARHILGRKKGPLVINLSTSLATEEVALNAGCPVFRTRIGESWVVERMKEKGAVIGGEGNGGVIFPDLHLGRDGLMGMALILEFMAQSGERLSTLASSIPRYYMVKGKTPFGREEFGRVLPMVAGAFPRTKTDLTDGIRVSGEGYWVHLRPSNTEPVVRIIAEARSPEGARDLFSKAMEMMGNQGRGENLCL